MANTTKLQGGFLQIKGLDDDWELSTDLAGFDESGINVQSIQFTPSAAGDELIIKSSREGVADTATAPEIARLVSSDGEPRIKYFGRSAFGSRMWPFIDISDCTFDTAANARLEIELA